MEIIQDFENKAEESAVELVQENRQLSISEAKELAQVFFESKLFKDTTSMAQAVVKILAGSELGIGPFASMRGFNIIEGQLAPNAGLTGALIKRDSRYNYQVTQATKRICEINFLQVKGDEWKSLGVSSYSWEDAELAGLTNKYNWKKYPEAMLFARALTQGARRYCGDVFMGSVYTPEELGNESIESIGFDIDAEWKDESSQVSPKESMSDEEYINTILGAIEDGQFSPSDYIPLCNKLGISKDLQLEIKKSCESQEEVNGRKRTVTDFDCAAKKAIDKYREINN